MNRYLIILLLWSCLLVLACSSSDYVSQPNEKVVSFVDALRADSDMFPIRALEELTTERLEEMLQEEPRAGVRYLLAEVNQIVVERTNQSYYIEADWPVVQLVFELYPNAELSPMEGGKLIYLPKLIEALGD